MGTFAVVQNKGGMGDACLQQTSPGTSYRFCLGMEYYPFRGDLTQNLPLELRYNYV
jgi:hypothetical protein